MQSSSKPNEATPSDSGNADVQLGRSPGVKAENSAAQTLAQALLDANSVLAFTAQAQKHFIKASALRVAVAALQAQPSNEKETQFWQAYDELTTEMGAVSAASIKATQVLNGASWGVWCLSSPFWLMVSAAVLVFMIFVLQTYVNGGVKLVEILSQAQTKQIELNKEYAANDIRLNRWEQKVKDLKTKQSVVADKTVQVDFLSPEIEALYDAQKKISYELAQFSANSKYAHDLVPHWLAAPFSVLGLQGIKAQYEGEWQTLSLRERQLNAKHNEMKLISPSLNDQFAAATAKWQLRNDQRMLDKDKNEHHTRKTSAYQVLLTMLLMPLSEYVIPALVGALGAIMFLLRDISLRLKDHTYLPLGGARINADISLGLIAGVFGRLFLSGFTGSAGSQMSSLLTLRPLVLPFLCGFSGSLFFTLVTNLSVAFFEKLMPSPSPNQS